MDERPEVVETTPGTTAVVTSSAPGAAVDQSQATTYHSFSERRQSSYRLIQAVYLIFALIEALLAIRFVLRLLGANPDAGFARFISSLSAVFVTPFLGLIGTPESGGSMLEPQLLVAIVVYALLGWLVAKLIRLAFGESRSATVTAADGSTASVLDFLHPDAAANNQGRPGTAAARTTDRAAPLVSMVGVSRHFSAVAAVDRVTLDVPPASIVGIIGPSGSGKTTLVRMLTGTLKPTAGRVTVLGEDPIHFRRHTRERIGYMPQLFILYPDLTAAENVSFVGSLFGLLWPRRRRRVREVLELVELWDARNRRAGQLSGGMQRRLELACALIHEPTVLFLDEPTGGQDPILRQKIWDEFRRLRDQGRTLIVTTQYVGEADHCDRVAVLAEGRLIAFAEPEQLRRDALGGDVIEIETTRVVDSASLVGLTGITEVRQPGPRRLLVIAQDAGVAIPRLLETLRSQGVEVASSSEYHPSFDEVFGELVARKQHEQAATEPAVSAPRSLIQTSD
jgi:ABC-2 type transport system ATP-binding protein